MALHTDPMMMTMKNRQTILRATGAILLLAGVVPAWAEPAPAGKAI